MYVDFPFGFEGKRVDQVCKFKKALYDLKQSPKAWFDRFAKFVKCWGYTQAQSDHTLFLTFPGWNNYYFNSLCGWHYNYRRQSWKDRFLKRFLAPWFEIKEIGSLRYFLGMEVAQSKLEITISKRKYTLYLLKETCMLGCKPTETSMEQNSKLGPRDDETKVDR